MNERWPALNRPGWEGTRDHLRLWTQLMGKTRLAFAPHVNHWWQVALYVSPRGLTTSAIPAPGGREFDLELDLIEHRLIARSSDSPDKAIPLGSGSIADFFDAYLRLLGSIDVHPRLYTHPVEGVESIPFEDDHQFRPYDTDWASAFFRALTEIDRLLHVFRGAFLGKASPVHFFWGGFDLAATRFSGRRAPKHRGGIPNCPDSVQVEAYSHECSSAGFWPGGFGYPQAALYSYAYPEPPDFIDAPGLPEGAFYSRELGEFLFPYEALRQSEDPARAALAFFESTYASAAEHARWNRQELERAIVGPSFGGGSWRTSASISVPTSANHPL